MFGKITGPYRRASKRTIRLLLKKVLKPGLPGTMVILVGSGMCTDGRIVNHLKAGIEDPGNDIVFVGYQTVFNVLEFLQRKCCCIRFDPCKSKLKVLICKED